MEHCRSFFHPQDDAPQRDKHITTLRNYLTERRYSMRFDRTGYFLAPVDGDKIRKIYIDLGMGLGRLPEDGRGSSHYIDNLDTEFRVTEGAGIAVLCKIGRFKNIFREDENK